MPKEEKMVDLDTSGEGAEINLEEQKDESVVETEAPKEGIEAAQPVETKEEEVKEEPKEELKEGSKPKEDDDKLESYSKGVQKRIAELTKRMRSAERDAQKANKERRAALDYAKAVEKKRKSLDSRFGQVNKDYVTQFEKRVKDGMEMAQSELSRAIESGDATAQVNAQKRIAALSIDEARLNVMKETTPAEEKPVKLEDAEDLPTETPKQLPDPDPKAQEWAANNTWFGQDRPMTFTAFEIHKDLVEKEGYDAKSDEYYAEVDKRMRLEFPNKFDINDGNTSNKPTQTVASARRPVRQGSRKTVKLTSSQVAIAKKLGVPLEEYAKPLNITKEV